MSERVLDEWELKQYATWIKQLPEPEKACVPIGDTGGRKLYGATAEDCVHELTPEELFDPRRCPPDELKDRTIPSRYCVEALGTYFGRLVRLRDVTLTVSEDIGATCTAVHTPPCTATSGPCCMEIGRPYPCFGQWWGVVGLALGARVVPLASVNGELEITCGRGWNKKRTFVPDRGTSRDPHCQPICEPWVWKKQTLIVRPTAAGLLLVLPPPGINRKYLLPPSP